MLSFFDPRKPMGRGDYFLSFVFRLICLVLLYVTLMIVFLFFSISGEVTEASVDAAAKAIDLDNPYAVALTNFLSLAFLLPIDIRRALDIHIDLKWILFSWAPALLPVQLMLQSGPMAGILVMIYAFCAVIQLILFFKPGEIYKAYVRGESTQH